MHVVRRGKTKILSSRLHVMRLSPSVVTNWETSSKSQSDLCSDSDERRKRRGKRKKELSPEAPWLLPHLLTPGISSQDWRSRSVGGSSCARSTYERNFSPTYFLRSPSSSSVARYPRLTLPGKEGRLILLLSISMRFKENPRGD